MKPAWTKSWNTLLFPLWLRRTSQRTQTPQLFNGPMTLTDHFFPECFTSFWRCPQFNPVEEILGWGWQELGAAWRIEEGGSQQAHPCTYSIHHFQLNSFELSTPPTTTTTMVSLTLLCYEPLPPPTSLFISLCFSCLPPPPPAFCFHLTSEQSQNFHPNMPLFFFFF